MTYTDEIALDFNAKTNFPIVAAKQNDTNSRIFLIHFTQDGTAVEISDIIKVGYRIRKPDGHIVLNNGVNNKDGTATITLTQQCLAAAGRAYADIYLHENGELLSTTSFIINIMASPNVMTSAATSSDEFLYLMSFLNDAEDIIGEAQQYADDAENLISSSASYLFFDIDHTDGNLYVFRPESDSFSSEMDFSLNNNGELVVNLSNGQ